LFVVVVVVVAAAAAVVVVGGGIVIISSSSSPSSLCMLYTDLHTGSVHRSCSWVSASLTRSWIHAVRSPWSWEPTYCRRRSWMTWGVRDSWLDCRADKSSPAPDAPITLTIITLSCVFTGVSIACLRSGCPSVVLSVCPSVCPSVTGWHWVKTTQARITKSSPSDSPRTLVLAIKSSSRNSKGFTPSEGVKWQWGRKNSQFSANKSQKRCKDDRVYLPTEPYLSILSCLELRYIT